MQVCVDEVAKEKDAKQKMHFHLLFAGYDGRVHQKVISIIKAATRRVNWASPVFSKLL
jgi:hypothetical protein